MERHSFRIVSGDSPKTLQKLCLSIKFIHQEIRWNYGILQVWNSNHEIIRVMVKLFKVLLNKNQKVSTCSKTYLNLNPMGHLYSQTRQNFLFDHSKHIYHCVKNRPNTEFFSGPYFPEFGRSTGKYGPEKTPYLDTSHVVYF